MISDIDIHVLYPESFNDLVEGVTERECYKGENPSSIECPPGKCALAPHIPFERAHQMHQE